MKNNSKPSTENEQLLQTIISRQTELVGLTNRLIETANKARQQEKQTEAYDWFSSLKTNNSTSLLSKAI